MALDIDSDGDQDLVLSEAQGIKILRNQRIEVGVSNDSPPRPQETAIMRNYPNPFNTSTTIEYYLPEAGDICIEIYSLLGQKIARLDQTSKSAGKHSIVWDASDVSSGLYFARLRGERVNITRKMMLLK
jgi:hypothetical protein